MKDNIKKELEIIWQAQEKLGLKGKMKLYTTPDNEPWRAKTPSFEFFFGPDEIEAAIEKVEEHYNNGKLPNSTLLLSPVVYDENNEPIGSAVTWATVFCKGIAKLKGTERERLNGVGVYSDFFTRGEIDDAGLKIIGFADRILKPEKSRDGHCYIVEGCRELYELCDIDSEEYFGHYVLSGLNYLCKNGSYIHKGEISNPGTAKIQTIKDAAFCWNQYDRHHTLYLRFGIDVKNVDTNLKYFNLCARNFEFFDATGPMRKGADQSFEFVVQGLIPRGAVTVLAGAGGTGKSSIAHELCVKSGIDYDPGEAKPLWLGQPINYENTKGVCVYFSGEDGPAVINARAELFDPKGRAKRVMFQRTEFRDREETLPQFMARLATMPDVPIMVIDPARKYLEGDENNSEVVSEFFEAIEEFAIKKKCAMIVVHHLEKGAKPGSCREILDLLRGSQVFIDRPRVVLGLYRDGPYTCVGLAKCNIPPNVGMVMDERVFARDPKTLQLIQLPGEKGIRRATLTEDELEQIKAEAELKEAKENILKEMEQNKA